MPVLNCTFEASDIEIAEDASDNVLSELIIVASANPAKPALAALYLGCAGEARAIIEKNGRIGGPHSIADTAVDIEPGPRRRRDRWRYINGGFGGHVSGVRDIDNAERGDSHGH